MNTLKINAAHDASRWFRLLEKRGLIKTLKPSAKILRSKRGRGSVDVVYTSSPRFGTHKLICVKPDSAVPRLNSHPDNEEFILLDPGKGRKRPLYLLIGLSAHAVLKKKAAAGTLGADDFVLLRVPFNPAPECVFTMCKGTVHCEIVFPGRAAAPVFFVSEPSRLRMDFFKTPGYSFRLSEDAAP